MRRTLRYLTCGAAALLLGGCWWPMPGSTPGRQAHNPAEAALTTATVTTIEEQWTATTDDGPTGDPVTSTAGVHVNDQVAVHTFSTTTGAELWTYDPGVGASQPYVTGDEVWTSGSNGPTVTLNASSGALLRTVVADQGLAALSDGHAVTWFHEIGTLVDVLHRPSGDWPCCGSLLFLGAPETTTLGTDAFFHAGNGFVDPLLGTAGNGVREYRIDPPSPCPFAPYGMCPVWATPLDGGSSTAPVLGVDQATVYVGTNAGTVYAVDAATGAIEWSGAVGSAVVASPALADGVLYVPTEGNGLVVLDAADGTPTWTGTTDGAAVTEQPAVAADVVYVGTAEGDVLAFGAAGCGTATCDPLWSDDLGGAVTGAPAVSNGQLFVGTADGRLVAYGLG